jgi:hypothetical protein
MAMSHKFTCSRAHDEDLHRAVIPSPGQPVLDLMASHNLPKYCAQWLNASLAVSQVLSRGTYSSKVWDTIFRPEFCDSSWRGYSVDFVSNTFIRTRKNIIFSILFSKMACPTVYLFEST